MIVRKIRLENGWSQEQLAEMSGLSVRTIQRIERGQKPGLESLKCLAAVFDTDVSNLMMETEMSNESDKERFRMSADERSAIEYVRELKAFYSHLITFVIVMLGLYFFNIWTSPEYLWFWWPLFGWGIGVFIHGVSVFEVFSFFSPEWEQKQIEKRLRKRG